MPTKARKLREGIEFRELLKPGLRMIFEESYGVDPAKSKSFVDYLYKHPKEAEKMFPPAEDDEE